jgi:hypothetical protein
MKRLFVAVTIGIDCVQGISQAGQERGDVYEIRRPTVIALFVANAIRSNDSTGADVAEAGSDFSYYASLVQERLRHAGIDFQISEAPSFQIRNKESTLNFHASSLGVGCVFIAPGRRPRVIRGVTADQDLIEQARDYFRIAIR